MSKMITVPGVGFVEETTTEHITMPGIGFYEQTFTEVPSFQPTWALQQSGIIGAM